ncbi:gliding motility-associated C-terminal domain-containing protein [Mucilaginibacter sp. OK098]|uniref:T9SS type B sorting domain-containing protein n=1 Tax=Mucilaginibacter sp. OK098 TaxID=1855297 RepID=UPI001F2A5A33|nr:gliding motility-associated C-terminal domain-containing protein [Mucilaginibacter sp. OK098]
MHSDNIVLNGVALSTTPPEISYETPQNYVLNQSISPLAPTNIGGAVPVAIYGKLSAVTGSVFSVVTGIAVDASGNIYVADFYNNQVKVINTAGTVSLFAGSSSGMSGADNGPRTSATFYEPDALLFDKSGNLYISDIKNGLIRKINSAGLVSTFAGNGATGFTDGTGTSASFYYPRGMAIDNSGNLYVADQGNNVIRKITPSGIVSTFAGNGTAGSANGPNLIASFNIPTAITIDASGNLYVSDSGDGTIRKITIAGMVSTLASGLNFPRELIVDGTGNIYVTEQQGYSIKRISLNGSETEIVPAGLSGPIGLAPDGKGNLIIGDMNSVKKVSISGYTIDKQLPAGLNSDPTTGIISGTPTALSPSANYTINAYNSGGSNTTVVNIAVGLTKVLKQSIITLPPQQPTGLDASNNYDPKATSTNNETPIIYTSSNPSVATVTPDGLLIHVIAPGITTITAYQKGNANYSDATPVQQILTVVEYLFVNLPEIAVKTICDADFSADASTSEVKIPLTFNSSNLAVATISDQGIIHIAGSGVTTITVSQNANPPLYVSATPQSKTLTVTLPVTPVVSIAAQYINPCVGSSVIFTATTDNGGANPNYQWKVNGNNTGVNAKTFTSSVLADGDVVTCTSTNTDNACIAGFPEVSNPVKLNLITPSTPAVSISASVNGVYPGVPITFTAVVSNANGLVGYQWAVNGYNAGTGASVFISDTFVNGDIVTCAITPTTVCSMPAISEPIKVIIVSKLEIPNTFTPNGDGINDTWNISGIANYPNCFVNIYNRYGMPVFQSRGYHHAWDGTMNGAKVPVSTYYYVIDLGSQNRKISGDITIIR